MFCLVDRGHQWSYCRHVVVVVSECVAERVAVVEIEWVPCYLIVVYICSIDRVVRLVELDFLLLAVASICLDLSISRSLEPKSSTILQS